MNSSTFDKVLVGFFSILLAIFVYNYFTYDSDDQEFTNADNTVTTTTNTTKFTVSPTPTPEVTEENYHPKDKNDVKQFSPSVRDNTSKNYINYIFGTRTYKD